MLYKKRGQSTLEYAMLIVAIVAAFTLISHYVKRATEGQVKKAGDQIGNQFDATGTYQTAWKNEAGDTITTTEKRATGTGDTTTTIARTGSTARAEEDKFGDQVAHPTDIAGGW